MSQVSELSQSFESIEEDIANTAGETRARWQVLRAFVGEPATVSQAARHLGLVRQSVGRVVDLLVQDKLLKPTRNPSHKRASLFEITARGRRTLDKIEKRSRTFGNAMASRTTKRQLRELLDALRKLSDTTDRSRPAE